MELICLGIILFIAGVGATIVYDKVKEQRAAQAAKAPTTRTRKRKLDPVEEEFEAFKSHMEKKRATGNTGVSGLNKLLQEVKARQAAGQTTVSVQRGTKTQTVSVDQLIKQLEDMKKKL